MKLQQSPETGLCILTSFAMVLDMSAEMLLERIGNGWKTLAFPNLPVPYCWRGVHIQELILVALKHNYAVTPVELMPQAGPPQAIDPVTRVAYQDVTVFHGSTETINWDIFCNVIMSCSGVLTGVIAPRLTKYQRSHAVAFEKGVIFDPSSEAYMYSVKQCEARNFYANCAWRFDKMEIS